MTIGSKIKTFILNNSIRANLLSLYAVILVVMTFLLATMLFYSIDLNSSYNKIMSNLENYNKITYQVNSIDKDIYLNITEQKPFDARHYGEVLSDINAELDEVANNFDQNQDLTSIASVEILKRTVNKLGRYIGKTNLSIEHNANFASREKLLVEVTHVKDLIKDDVQELLQFDLTQSQKHINAIKSSYNTALALIIVLIVISVIASVSFLLLVIQDSVRKINIVSEHANSLANGDLSIDSINLGENNEFKVLAMSFNKMKNNIKDYVSQLSSNEMRISSIQNAINDCIVTTNTLGVIESSNNAIEKMFGYSKDEILGRNISELVSAVDFSRYEHELFNSQKLIKGVKLIDNKYQLDAKRKDETIIPIEMSYNEVQIEGQRITTFVIHDITQHKNVEKMKDEFISIVSHELRTPLTSIKGALGVVLAGVLGTLPDKVNEMLNIANNNCSRLSDLINDILDMEKIKAGQMNFDLQEYDVIPIVNEALESSFEYAKQYNVEYKMNNSLDSAIVNVDKNRLIQALLNLLSNAAKFSHANSTVNVDVAKLDNETIRISVKDSGIGISEEFRSRIFNNFSQADSSDARKKGGSGLGLSITKEIITIMGGKVDFESKSNEGSTFYIDLPAKV